MKDDSSSDHAGQSILIDYINLKARDLSEDQVSIVAKFSAVYQRLNELSADPGEKDAERLKAIESALRERDDLENDYAPMGILVEPEYRENVAVRLEVTVGSMKADTRAAQVWISSSAILDFT